MIKDQRRKPRSVVISIPLHHQNSLPNLVSEDYDSHAGEDSEALRQDWDSVLNVFSGGGTSSERDRRSDIVSKLLSCVRSSLYSRNLVEFYVLAT